MIDALTFYVVRFAAPSGGLPAPGLHRETARPRGGSSCSASRVSVTILVGVLFVVRSDALARRVGTRRPAGPTGAQGRRRRGVGAGMPRLPSRHLGPLPHGFPRSLVALVGMLVADLAILALCLRFVGVDRSEVGLLAIARRLPLRLSVHDLAVLGHRRRRRPGARRPGRSRRHRDRGGVRGSAARLAGLTVAGPVLMGVGALAIWRRTLPREPVGELGRG